MSDIKRILSGINHLDTYQRVDSTHPLDLYVGIDDTARWTLLLISDFQPLSVTSSRMIMIKSGKRSDSKWTQSFSLVDDRFRDIFSCSVRILYPRRPILQTKKKPSASWGNATKSGGKCWRMPGETCFPQRKSKAFWAKCTI